VSERLGRIVIDGESIDVVIEAGSVGAIRKALALGRDKRRRDLDRIVGAALDRDPHATLDELCAIARRNRQEVALSRKRVREARESRSDASARESAVPGPENRISALVGNEGETSA
jgi:hypothetical protein